METPAGPNGQKRGYGAPGNEHKTDRKAKPWRIATGCYSMV
jgi:hypothetical protein